MARKVAFGGIFTALTVLLLYFAAVVPTGRLAAYTLCSLPIALSIVELGVSGGVMVYTSASVLALLLTGNIAEVMPFILFFGHYGIFKYYIERYRRALAEILLKLLVFNTSIALAYFMVTRFFGYAIAGVFGTSVLWSSALLLFAQVVFFMYDYVFSRLIFFYQEKRGLILKKGN